jgi:membrane protein
MMARLKKLFTLLKDTFNEWNEDKCPRLAAALAYFTAFSLAPLLIVVISIAGFIFGRDAVQGRVQAQIQGAVGAQAAGAIQEMLANTGNHPATGVLATVIGIVTLLLGAAGLFGALQDALDTVWEVAPKPQGIMVMLRQRFISFTMVLGIGFVLLVSLVLSAAISAVQTWVKVQVPGQGTILQIINIVISFGVITLLFAAIFKVLPDVKISWKDVWVGAAVTGLLFTIGKYLLGLYLGQSSVASGFGAAGSFVVLLLWIFYSSQILLFGAEFTQVYARTYGSRIVPSKNAVDLSELARIHQGIPRSDEVAALAKGKLPPSQTDKATPSGAKKNQALEDRRTQAEHERLAPVGSAETPQDAHIGAVVLGICAALATFVIGMLIGTDQKHLK